MQRKIINPWQWQDQFGFVQGNDVSGHSRILFCAGQTSNDGQGNVQHVGDMRGQMALALSNLETVLGQADLTLSNVMRLTYYTTDVDRFLECYDVLMQRFQAADCKPAATLLGVQRLAFPDLMVEIEATAAA